MILQNARLRASASDARDDSDKSRIKSRIADRVMEHDVSLAARSDTCVLLTGRTAAAGALARRIHAASGWRHGSFLVVDCQAPAQLLNERLFSLLSSVDPAPRSTPGVRLVQAGTVFLQEVGGLGAAVQVRLADRLEELRATGRQARARWRVIASSSEPLVQRVAEGTFDDRLFYRLNVIHLFARDARRSRTAGVAEDTAASAVSPWTQELRTPAAQQRELSQDRNVSPDESVPLTRLKTTPIGVWRLTLLQETLKPHSTPVPPLRSQDRAPRSSGTSPLRAPARLG